MDQFNDIERTFVAPINDGIDFSGNLIVIFDENDDPVTINLSDYNQYDEVTVSRVTDPQQTVNHIARSSEEAVVYVKSRLVSRRGSIHFLKKNNFWKVKDDQGRLQRGDKQLNKAASLLGADLLKLVNDEDPNDVFLMIAYSSAGESAWKSVELDRGKGITLGRDENSSDVYLPDINVSRNHADFRFIEKNGSWEITNHSPNGTYINGEKIENHTLLKNKDVIQIGKTHFVIVQSSGDEGDKLYYHTFGNSIEVINVVVRRGNLIKGVATRTNHVSMKVEAGELVAIVGGSGAGKSTLLNCMCGYLKPAEGHVLINGVDLYDKYNDLRHLIGYVPQSDIVYDQLTVEQMLTYSARLRLPETLPNANKKDIEAVVNRAINIVELTHKRKAKIGELSGGQRKRASIAVELLSNPDILFLDEPTSGLDPQTEKELMLSLRKMADSGKAVILVTHSTLQLKMCNKVAFVGPGGYLRFYGSLEEAFRFFETQDVVEIFEKIEKMGRGAQRVSGADKQDVPKEQSSDSSSRKLFGHHRVNRLKQFPVLLQRNFSILFSSPGKSLLTILSYAFPALIIAFIFPNIVSDKDLFVSGLQIRENATLILYLLCCTICFFVTLVSSTQICKEFTVLNREKMAGESLLIYYIAKLICLSSLDLIASTLTYLSFVSVYDIPELEHVWNAKTELFVTIFLIYLSFTIIGLLVSSVVKKPDATSTAAALVLISQILLSGILLKLSGFLDTVKQIIISFHSTTALGIIVEKYPRLFVSDEEFEYTAEHLSHTWYVILIISAVFAVLTLVWLWLNMRTEVSKKEDKPGLFSKK